MGADSGGEKTEKPTPKRKKQARKDGQVPRTPELGGWAALLLITLALGPLLDNELEAIRTMMATHFRAVEDPSLPLALTLLGDAGQHMFVSLVILGVIVMFVGVVSALSQGGFYVSTKSVKPDFKKLDPIKGAKRLFGPHALWEGAKVLVKSSVVAFIAYGAIRSMVPLVGGLVPIDYVLHQVRSEVSHLMLTVALAGLVMAAADYAMMRRRIGKQIRMSLHEIKQEHKQSEGDPMLKGAIRARQLAAARNRMISDVSTADVLLVNPTHVAVALRYDPERGAPRVVARGAGAIAAKIREKAAEERIPLVQDIPLARALYRHCQVGQEIPRELWAAVAQVLAFVLSRRRQGQYGGEHRTPRRTEELPEVLDAARRRRAAAAVAVQESP